MSSTVSRGASSSFGEKPLPCLSAASSRELTALTRRSNSSERVGSVLRSMPLVRMMSTAKSKVGTGGVEAVCLIVGYSGAVGAFGVGNELLDAVSVGRNPGGVGTCWCGSGCCVAWQFVAMEGAVVCTGALPGAAAVVAESAGHPARRMSGRQDARMIAIRRSGCVNERPFMRVPLGFKNNESPEASTDEKVCVPHLIVRRSRGGLVGCRVSAGVTGRSVELHRGRVVEVNLLTRARVVRHAEAPSSAKNRPKLMDGVL